MATQSGTELRSFVHLGDEDNCYLKTEKGGDPPENWGVELGKIEACLARLDASLATPIDGKSISTEDAAHCRTRASLHLDPAPLPTSTLFIQRPSLEMG